MTKLRIIPRMTVCNYQAIVTSATPDEVFAIINSAVAEGTEIINHALDGPLMRNISSYCGNAIPPYVEWDNWDEDALDAGETAVLIHQVGDTACYLYIVKEMQAH